LIIVVVKLSVGTDGHSEAAPADCGRRRPAPARPLSERSRRLPDATHDDQGRM
jgi:hypothetical protein